MTYKEKEVIYQEIKRAMEKQILECEIGTRYCQRAKISGKPSLDVQSQLQKLENIYKDTKIALEEKIDIIEDELEHIK